MDERERKIEALQHGDDGAAARNEKSYIQRLSPLPTRALLAAEFAGVEPETGSGSLAGVPGRSVSSCGSRSRPTMSAFLRTTARQNSNGARVTKWAHMKKSVYSLPALRGPACRQPPLLRVHLHPRRSECWAGKLRKPSQTVTDHERSYRGFNLFCEEDQQLMQVLARGEFNIRGLQNRTLRDHLPEKNGGQVSRLLKRLRLHRFIKKVGHTYRYYLTHFGKEIIAAALKLKELVLIPQLAPKPGVVTQLFSACLGHNLET